MENKKIEEKNTQGCDVKQSPPTTGCGVGMTIGSVHKGALEAVSLMSVVQVSSGSWSYLYPYTISHGLSMQGLEEEVDF